jgi:hypothetical protein
MPFARQFLCLTGTSLLTASCADPPVDHQDNGPTAQQVETFPPFDADSAHQAAWQEARPSAVSFAEAMGQWRPDASAEIRRALASALKKVRLAIEGIDPTRLDAEAAREHSALILLIPRAEAHLSTEDSSRVDAHLLPRRVETSLNCAETSIAREGKVSADCLSQLGDDARLARLLRATSVPAMDAAIGRLEKTCSRREKVSGDEVWKEWSTASTEACTAGLDKLRSFQASLDPEGVEAGAWAARGIGPNPQDELRTASALPPPKLARKWFRLASGWSGASAPLLQSTVELLAFLRQSLTKHDGTGATRELEFSVADCQVAARPLAAAVARRGLQGNIDCEQLQRAALGRTFAAGEQGRWILRRSALDSPGFSTPEDSEILKRFRSPTLPVLSLIEPGILADAELDSAALAAKEELRERLCAAKIAARSMSGRPQLEQSVLCPDDGRERVMADPLGAIRDIELSLLRGSIDESNALDRRYWLPLGWKWQRTPTDTDTSPQRVGPSGPPTPPPGLAIEFDQIAKENDPPPAK